MQYDSGTEISVGDHVILPGIPAFAGTIRGVFPPENLIEVLNDNPAVYPWHVELVTPDKLIPMWEY